MINRYPSESLSLNFFKNYTYNLKLIAKVKVKRRARVIVLCVLKLTPWSVYNRKNALNVRDNLRP